ncbi:MAG TPA: flagellar hook-associated protein FlgK [Phycisphaerae bacterium]|nr:flagellar hook-associated protein FlgK [Phycisphaerae bacterium]
MGLTSALGIGRSALAAYQAALQIVGNNIANVGTAGYTRTSADLNAIPGVNLGFGQVGNGVNLGGVRRAVSEAINARLRTAASDKQSASAQQSNLDRIEGIVDPLGDVNLGSLLGDFFKSLNDLQNNPQNSATRGIVISTATGLAQHIRDIRSDLLAVRDDANTEIQQATQRADDLATKIADLNTQITTAEAGGGGPASALRDQRDQLLSQLSEIFAINVREQPSGAVNVYIGNEALIQFGQSFGLTTSTELNSDGLATAVVRFAHNRGPVPTSSGQVAGLIKTRDTDVGAQMSRLDSLAAALISEINKIHAGGKGLTGFSNLTGISAVIDPSVALSATDNGISFPPKTGSFFIDVKDASGAVVRTQVNIDLDGIGADSTLNSVAADINANVANVTATVLADGRLQLSATGGCTFTFADDTSGFLAAMGLNTFFTGKNSLDIAVNPLISGNTNLLAAAVGDQPGDGANATALASLQDQAVSSLGGASLNEYYTATVSTLAVSVSGANSAADASSTIFDSLTAQRESISGVNLDEETVSLISYQRAFEGAARYMTVVDDMLQTLLTLVQ